MTEPVALVVEDEHDLARLYAQAVAKAGFVTEVVEAGDIALTRLQQMTPDLIILDLWLPVVDGATILRQVRADPRLASAQVVVITADPSSVQVYELDTDLIMIKPVSFTQLYDLARRLLPGR